MFGTDKVELTVSLLTDDQFFTKIVARTLGTYQFVSTMTSCDTVNSNSNHSSSLNKISLTLIFPGLKINAIVFENIVEEYTKSQIDMKYSSDDNNSF